MCPRISLLDEKQQPPNYDVSEIERIGFKRYSIPIKDDWGVRGWSVFSDEEIANIRDYVHKIIPPNPKSEREQE